MKWRIEREPVSREGIGVARFLYFAIAVGTISVARLGAFGQFAGPICPELNGSFDFISVHAWTGELGVLFQIASIFAAIGFLTRISMAVSFLSLLLLNFNALQFCYIDHRVLPLHVGMFLWLLLDRNSAFRVDDFVFSRAQKLESAAEVQLPLQMRLYFCIVFFLSGFSKIRYGGWDWVATDSMRNILSVQNYALEDLWASREFLKLNAWIVGQPWLCKLIAFNAVVVEVLAPFALLKTRFRNVIVLDLALLQIGIFVLMYINFSTWAALYVFWLPLNSWGAWIARRKSAILKVRGAGLETSDV